MTMRRLGSAGAVLLLVSLLFSACGPAGRDEGTKAVNHESLNLIPPGVTVVASARMEKLFNDPQVKGLLERITELAGEEVSGVLSLTGADATCAFDLRPKFIVAFGSFKGDRLAGILDSNGNPLEEGDSGAIITEGSYEKSQVLKCFVGPDGAAPKAVSYKGVEVYQAVSGGDPLSIAFLSDGLYATGTPEVIVSVIDIFKGEKSGLRGPLVRYHDQRDTALAKVSATAIGDLIGEEDQDAQDVPAAFRKIQALTLQFEKARRDFVVKVRVDLPSRKEADDLRTVVGAAQALASLSDDENDDMEGITKALSDIFKRTRSAVSGNSYVLSITFSSDDIESFVATALKAAQELQDDEE